MVYFKKAVHWLSAIMGRIAGAALVVMTLFIFVHVVMRSLIQKPIEGTFEVTGYLAAVAIPFSLAYAAVERSHIVVDIFVRKFSPQIQAVIDSITGILGAALFVLIAWYNAFYATKLWQIGDVSTGLRLPYFYFVYGVALCSAVMSLVLLIQVVESLVRVVKK